MNTEPVGLEVQLVDPAIILADDNSRYTLKKTRIDSLVEDIRKRGEVMEPVEIEALSEAQDGKMFRMVDGHYRLAAVLKLNEEGAGMQLPAIIREPAPQRLERLERQLSHNLERENQTPMDRAVAIKMLMDAGMSRPEIRNRFAAPGGRKGTTVQPMSNAALNMYLSFLELPKAIQEKGHNGLIGVGALYELTKVSPEQRQKVLDRAEADRLKAVEAEEKAENTLLDEEKRAAAEREKEAKTAKELAEARATLEATLKLAQEKEKEANTAFNAAKQALKAGDKEAKSKADEHFKAANADAEGAIKKAKEAEKVVAKIEGQAKKTAELAAERAKKLADARKAAKEAKAGGKTEGALGAGEVKKAAASVGAATGPVPLTAPQMRKYVEDLCLPSAFPKVRLIGEAFKSAFAGGITDKQLLAKLAEITGEKKASAAKK